MARFSEEYTFLLENYSSILSLVGRSFDSGDFITAFKERYHNEYALAISKCNSRRVFNSWVARWFLTSLESRGALIKGGVKPRLSTNRNKTRNHYWSKI